MDKTANEMFSDIASDVMIDYITADVMTHDLYFLSTEYACVRDAMMNRWLHKLRVYFLGNKIHSEVLATEAVPESWWDAFKERWYPAFLKKRFPIKRRIINTNINFVHVCPHASIPWSKDQYPHVTFLTEGKGR